MRKKGGPGKATDAESSGAPEVTVGGKYLRFEERGQRFNGKPVYYVVSRKHGNDLAQVFWYPRFNSWSARFWADTVWSEDCLQEVRALLVALEV